MKFESKGAVKSADDTSSLVQINVQSILLLSLQAHKARMLMVNVGLIQCKRMFHCIAHNRQYTFFKAAVVFFRENAKGTALSKVYP